MAERKEVSKPAAKAPAKRQSRKQDEPPRAVLWGGIVTSLIKLGGLLIAGNEAILQESPHDAVVFGIAAFMMAGAQGIDSFLTPFLNARRNGA